MGRENVGLVGLWDCVAFDELRPWYLWETSIKAWMQYVMGHSDAQITMKNSIAVRCEKENDISAIIVFDVTRAWAETKTSKDIGERP